MLINLQCPTTQVSKNVEIKYFPCILVMVLKNKSCICLDLKIVVHVLQNIAGLFYRWLVAHTLCSLWRSEKWKGNAQDCVFCIRVDKKPSTWIEQQFVTYEFITGNYPAVFSVCRKYCLIPKVFEARRVKETAYCWWQEYLSVVRAYGSFKSKDFESFLLPYATICTPFVVLWFLTKLRSKPSYFICAG